MHRFRRQIAQEMKGSSRSRDRLQPRFIEGKRTRRADVNGASKAKPASFCRPSFCRNSSAIHGKYLFDGSIHNKDHIWPVKRLHKAVGRAASVPFN
jgi:hypothetical protein